MGNGNEVILPRLLPQKKRRRFILISRRKSLALKFEEFKQLLIAVKTTKEIRKFVDMRCD